MAEIWDPYVVFRYKYDVSSKGTLSSGAEWISDVYELPPDEVLEVYRLELIPPVDTSTGSIKKLRYVTLMINGKEYESIRINSVMAPLEHETNVAMAIDFGVPYLHRPITGKIPTGTEGKCPKVKRGQTLGVKVIADENINYDFEIILRAARVRGESKLVSVVGTNAVTASFNLNGDFYSKSVPITLDSWDELPGGLAQSKPQIFPWFVYARNKQATTANTWYNFEYYNYVNYEWQNLSWNLINKEVAYLVQHLGVIPATDSESLRFYIEGRVTNPEFPIRPLPEWNYFPPSMYYDTSINASIKKPGPVEIEPPILFHGVKGGIQIIDDGTSIPANGVELLVWGTKYVLK